MNNLELYLAERTQFFSIYRMACQTTIERMDPGRISFCLTDGRCEGDAISDEVRAIMESRWAQAAASKAAALTVMS
jgi:hypothetical protein